ncbi:MAG: riboflavin synthase [Thermodesulfobacteriota bacterium]
MFTGIVEGRGKVLRVEHRGEMKRLTLEVPFDLTEVQLGDSININGVCLTVVERRGKAISVDLSPESLQRTALVRIKEGDQANVERALRLSDRLGGHIVTGHVDGIGEIIERRKEGNSLQLKIRIPRSVSAYVVPKGSIAIDGISLTINECHEDWIGLTLIPYTLEKTTLMQKKVGEEVNIEADILGKYVEKVLGQGKGRSPKMTLSFLKEHGFLKDE